MSKDCNIGLLNLPRIPKYLSEEEQEIIRKEYMSLGGKYSCKFAYKKKGNFRRLE